MKKIILLALVFMSATLTNGQVLYRISGNKLKKPSYIVGTHHLVDESFVNKIPGIKTAMNKTEQVYGEVVMTDLMNPDTVQMMQNAMMLPDNQTLKDVLDAEHYEMLNKIFTELIGVPFDFPQVYEAMGRIKPSALETQMSTLIYLKDNPGAFDPTKGIDNYFQNQAITAGKKVGGLESAQFQINLLLNSMKPEEELNSFYCSLENFETTKKQIMVLTEAYQQQNALGMTEAINMKYGNDCDKYSEEFSHKLITMRNNNWVAKMPKIMKKKPTLFVVGAGHLLDETGVITLLRAAGYTVDPVTE